MRGLKLERIPDDQDEDEDLDLMKEEEDDSPSLLLSPSSSSLHWFEIEIETDFEIVRDPARSRLVPFNHPLSQVVKGTKPCLPVAVRHLNTVRHNNSSTSPVQFQIRFLNKMQILGTGSAFR